MARATSGDGGRGRGRPSIFDPAYRRRREAFLRFLRTGNSVTDAAEASGLGRSTVYAAVAEGRRLKKKRRDRCTAEELEYRDFSDEVRTAVAQAKALLVSRLYGASKKSWMAALSILRARYPAQWNPEVMARLARVVADEAPQQGLPGVRVRRESAKAQDGAA